MKQYLLRDNCIGMFVAGFSHQCKYFYWTDDKDLAMKFDSYSTAEKICKKSGNNDLRVILFE